MSVRRNKKSDDAKLEAYKWGLFAEWCVALILRMKGYKVLEKRFKTPLGEIDLICRKRNTLVFIEVKARRSLSTALLSLSPKGRKRIEKAASYYLQGRPDYSVLDLRFDFFAFQSPFMWQHLDNAWMTTA